MEMRFQGLAKVYLQGSEVLEVSESTSNDQVIYMVGSSESAIRIVDRRRLSVAAALRALHGEGGPDFADLFNQPALVEVRANGDHGEAEIIMSETDGNGHMPTPTLWLGVLDNGWIPAHNTDWEVLRPLDDQRTAFAAVVP